MASLTLESRPNNENHVASMQTQAETLCAPFPDFIHNKLDEYQQEFFGQTTDGQVIVVGAAPTKDSILLQSNDYLNISGNPRITNRQIEALAEQKRDLLMSFSFVQDNSVIRRFEKKIADYVGYQNAMLFTSGWNANIGVLEAIADENTNVYIDFFAHMSLWEGIKACSAKLHPFRHNDVVHLERLINRNGPGIIVVDSVYSTLGTICPLVEIANTAEKYDCVFVVDESHSLGLYGPQGAGLVAALNLSNKVHFITASLSKAFAGRAGIVLSANDIIVFMPYVCNPAIFSTTLLSHEVVALSATLDLIKESDEKREALHTKATYFREHLVALGYAVSSESQIVSIEVGTYKDMEIFRNALEARNVFGSVFCPPATPKNRLLMRFSLHSDISYTQLDYIIEVCEQIREQVGMKNWKPTKRFARRR